FITSDDPIGLYRKEDGPEGLYRSSLKDRMTGIVMPLSPRVLLVADHDFGPEVRPLNRLEVARCNSMVALPGRRFVYAMTPEFEWFDPETKTIRTPDDLPDVARRAKEVEKNLMVESPEAIEAVFQNIRRKDPL